MIEFLFRVYADFLSKKWKILSVRLKNAQGENGRLQCKYECHFHFCPVVPTALCFEAKAFWQS